MSIFALYLVACWSVVALVLAGVFPGSTLYVALLALYTAAPIFVFLSRRAWPFYPGAAFRVLVVRVVLYTQLLLPFVAIAGVLGALIGAPFSHAHVAAQIFAAVVFSAAVALLIVGYIGSRSLVVREVEATIPALPAAFDGMRIVQLSDLHVGPQISRAFLKRVVRNVEALNPDIIAVTGDLIDDRPEDVAIYAQELGKLDAPMGVFLIAGNHDVYAGWPAVEDELRKRINGHLLVNDSHMLQRDGARLAIVGTGDPAGGHGGLGSGPAPDIARAYAKVPPHVMSIALAHNPSLFPALVARGASLTLSGHTHWGQFAIPKRQWSLVSHSLRYAMGTYTEGNSMLYIAPGTGYWGLPFRIGALPEITRIILKSGTQSVIRMDEARRAQ